MTKSPVKVLLVEDSPIALKILQKLLTDIDVEVVGTACDGNKALELIPKVQPTVVCTDLYMKGMDGLELTKQVMAKYPRPILVISNGVHEKDTQNTFELLQSGALDVFPKPITGMSADYEQLKQTLINKIKVLAGVKVFKKLQKQTERDRAQFGSETRIQFPPLAPTNIEPATIKVIAIGASTGGPKALRQILRSLPAQLPVSLICTQHISLGFLQGLVDWLATECQLHVKIAQERESPAPGTVYFAPENHHLELDSQGRFVYTAYEPVDGHCPSITVAFRAVAKFYGKAAAGILLTGMGKDGAAGMQAIAATGGITIAQDEASCVVFGMPKEAIALGAARYVLPLDEIAPWLLDLINEQ